MGEDEVRAERCINVSSVGDEKSPETLGSAALLSGTVFGKVLGSN